ncbi:MAG: efflux RND transporter periplasmic adaptor subunit [Pseudomonadota bacterium]
MRSMNDMNFRPTVAALMLAAASSASAGEFPAVLSWADRSALSLPVSGQVKQVHVRAGQEVTAGAPLVSLDTRILEARLGEARAAVQSLERQRAEAEREAKRADELYARTVLSNVELEKAHIDRQRVEGQYQQARARLQVADVERGYGQLKAPFEARVLEVKVAAGEAISAAMQAPSLVEVARADSIDAVAILRADQMQGLTLGGKVEVDVDGHKGRGEVVSIESPREGGYRLVVRVARRDGWVAGMGGRILAP